MPDTYKEIGALLAGARQEKQKTLEEAADYTKIAAKYLAAVEAGNPAPLPSRPYFLLFARSYAQYLGVDPAVLETIEKDGRDAEAEPEPAPVVPMTSAARTEQRLLISIIAVFVIAIAVVLVIRWRDRAGAALSGGETVQNMAMKKTPNDSAAVDSPLVVPASPYQSPGKLVLVLWPRQPVGVVLLRDGDTVLNRRLETGEQQRWEADYRFSLSTDGAAGLAMTINDQPALPLAGLGSIVNNLEINQANYRQFLPPDSAALSRRAADSAASAAPNPKDTTRGGTRNGY
jgi:cytoskeleton protein RodZ